MATKKQKREAALAKREEFMARERARGLEALEASRKRHRDEIAEAERKREEIDREFLRKATSTREAAIAKILLTDDNLLKLAVAMNMTAGGIDHR